MKLSRLLDLIASRISDLARPKGKKKPPQGVLDLSNELKATKEGLRGKIRGVVGGLNGLIMDDGEVDWVKVSGGYIKVSLVFQHTTWPACQQRLFTPTMSTLLQLNAALMIRMTTL